MHSVACPNSKVPRWESGDSRTEEAKEEVGGGSKRSWGRVLHRDVGTERKIRGENRVRWKASGAEVQRNDIKHRRDRRTIAK